MPITSYLSRQNAWQPDKTANPTTKTMAITKKVQPRTKAEKEPEKQQRTEHEIQIERSNRCYAQRVLQLGEWAAKHGTVLKLAQSVICNAQQSWLDDDGKYDSVDLLMMDLDDAFDAIIMAIADLRRVEDKGYGYPLGGLKVRHNCGHEFVIALKDLPGDEEDWKLIQQSKEKQS